LQSSSLRLQACHRQQSGGGDYIKYFHSLLPSLY
jgi:hypothetical protein